MTIKSFYIYPIAFILLLACSLPTRAMNNNYAENGAKIDSLVTKFNTLDLINLNDDDHEVLQICDSMYTLSQQTSDIAHIITANTIYGRYYNAVAKYNDAFKYLTEAKELYEKSKFMSNFTCSNSIICLMWNNLGIYYINANLDYAQAQKYFVKAAETARQHYLYTEYSKIAYNMTLLNFTRGDGSGLEFAQEIYDQGSNWNDNYIKFMGEISLSIVYYTRSEYDKALKYIEEAIESPELHSYKVIAYTTYGNILSALGQKSEAEEAFKITQEHLNDELLTTASYSLFSYGRFLLEQNEPYKAIKLLNRATHYNDSENYNVFLYQIHLTISEAYSAIGNWHAALEAYKKYHKEYSKVFDIKSERALNELSLQYQAVSHRVKIQEYDLEVAQKDRLILILVFIFSIALTFGIFAWIMYRNNNKLYTKIAKQYKLALEKESELLTKIKHQKEEIQSLSKEEIPILNKPSLSEDLNKELFTHLEQMMNEEKIYKEHNLTLEMLAEKLSTNRTYLTRVINENTSKTFVQYVNYYRVEEALRLLSDLENNYPLKAICDDSGFTSRTTFYKFFKEQVGMTPAKYIERIKLT